MKVFNKYFLILLSTIAIIMVSCKEEIPSRDPSPIPDPNSTNVYFSNENISNHILDIDIDNFDIIINRENTDNEQTIPLSVHAVYLNGIEVPTSVTFAAGEDEKIINVKVKDMELMKMYHFTITIDENMPNPYKKQNISGRLELSILREDFVPYAEGIYSSEFFDDSWSAILEYSPSTDIYRFKDCWMIGYDVTFNWDKGATFSMIGSQSSGLTAIPTGYLHPTYGMVSANYDGEASYYDESTKTFNFVITWMVSAGSFGMFPDSYQITSEY